MRHLEAAPGIDRIVDSYVNWFLVEGEDRYSTSARRCGTPCATRRALRIVAALHTGGRGPQLVARAATADSNAAIASLDRVAETGAATVLTGHGEVWRAGADAIAETARARARLSTVLVNAGPWLSVPPPGYGGIENVLATLLPELRARGVRVILCATADSTLAVDRLVPSRVAPGAFAHIADPYNRTMGIAHAHMAGVVELLRDPGEPIDLVHDHLEVVGPAVLGAMGAAAPPVLQTLHWDLAKHPDFYRGFDGRARVRFVGVSERQLERAPAALRRQALGAIPLAVPLESFPFRALKDGPPLVLGRITAVKGTDVAARACRAAGLPLDVAGPVAGFGSPAALEAALADPAHGVHASEDATYFRESVRPLLDEGAGIRWLGSVAGEAKVERLGRARALVTPIRWEEPGATAVVEALACGTPVIGMRLGALPALVDHGTTGFLADDEAELAGYLGRLDELDPAACRAAAEARFSSGAFAEAYLERYAVTIALAG